jgi:2-hydroxychromene-2-carboxylate isomerase
MRRPVVGHRLRQPTRRSLTRLRLAALHLDVTHFTDPACPFAFSAEPVRTRLRWYYGEQLRWTTRMIVLTLEPGEAENLAQGAPDLQSKYGMPIDPVPHSRPASSEPACRAVVAARLHAPSQQEQLLRRLRVRVMLDGLLDDPELIAGAARDAGLDPAQLLEWCALDDVEAALQADIAAARDPLPAARALNHKLGGPGHQRRYTAPSYVMTASDGRTMAVPGFNPIEAYEAVIANLAPELERRPKPASVEELLGWADQPLATAEVTMITRLDPAETRAALSRVARAEPAGADFYWTLL